MKLYSAYFSNEGGDTFLGSFSTITLAESAIRNEYRLRGNTWKDLHSSTICDHELNGDPRDVKHLLYHESSEDWH